MRTINQRIRELRIKQGMTQDELAERAGYGSRTSIAKLENGERSVKETKLEPIARALHTTVAYLIGADVHDEETSELLAVKMPIIGEVKAGYNSLAETIDTGEYEYIPKEWLHRLNPDSFMVLRVSGDSMYPDFLDGDRVLVRLTPIVPSESVAVVVFEEYGTLKKIRYPKSQEYLQLIPLNREYTTKTISGEDLSRVIIVGQVWKTIRDNK